MPAVDVDAVPVASWARRCLKSMRSCCGVLVGDLLDAAGELVEAPVRAQLGERGVVAVVDEALGEVEVAHRACQSSGVSIRASSTEQKRRPSQWVKSSKSNSSAISRGSPRPRTAAGRAVVAVAGRGRRGGDARWGEVPSCREALAQTVWLTARRRTAWSCVGHRAGLAGQQRLPVGAVALVGELTQRVGERVWVGQVGERERLGQNRRELRRVIVQPTSACRTAPCAGGRACRSSRLQSVSRSRR